MSKRTILILLAMLLPVLPASAADQHYLYDDGSAENCQGGVAGDIVWLQYFDPQGGSELITHVSTAIGCAAAPGWATPTDDTVTVYVWDDPNNDGDPADAVLLGSGHGGVENVDTDLFTHYALDQPVAVTSRFFVGAMVHSDTVFYPRPLDLSQDSDGRTWMVGDTTGNFNPDDLTGNDTPLTALDSIGLDGIWLLRAHRLSPDVDGQSFDFLLDRTDIPGWTEQSGDWTVTGRRLVSEAASANQVITRNLVPQADGCVEVCGHYGDGTGLRYLGLMVRYQSAYDRIQVKLQDNDSSGYFDSCIVYDDTSSVFTATGQNYGTEPRLQVEFVGTTLHVRIDVDGEGNWDHDYPVAVTTTHPGLVGASAYNQVGFDDWHCAPEAGAWGGTVIGFDDVPQDYWYYGGGQSLGAYYSGLQFTPVVNVLESTVYGYGVTTFPWHSSDAVICALASDEVRVSFDEPKTHVGFWYTTVEGDGSAEAYDENGTLLDSAVLLNNRATNNYISLDGEGIEYVDLRCGHSGLLTIDDLEYQPVNYIGVDTISSSFTCSPQSGTLPFQVGMNVEMTNNYDQQIRRIAGKINVRLAGGATYTNWRAGYTNVAPLGSYTTSWVQNFPALGSLVGTTNFTLSALDVTPAPYNQPPYPASGDVEVRACNITAAAP